MRWLRRRRFRRQVGEIRSLNLDEVVGPPLRPDHDDQRQAPAGPQANHHRYADAGNTGRHWHSLLTPNLPGLLAYRGEHRSPLGRTLPS